MAHEETEHRKLVADAYEAARKDPGNVGELPPWMQWGTPEHTALFSCKVCGEMCSSSPGPGQAVCEKHCEDHDYEYDRYERGHFCKHCNAPRPYDWDSE